MSNLKQIQCDICGQFAQVSSKRKFNYCDRPECVEEYKRRKYREYTNRYNAKQREENKNKPEKVIAIKKVEGNATSEIAPKVVTAKEVLRATKVNTEAIDQIEIYDIREIARQLGTIRFKLIEMYQKEDEQAKEVQKDDITMLHAFEFEDLTKEDVWEMYKNTKKRRTSRRGNKYRKAIIQTLLSSIEIKNPDKFVVKAINDGRQSRDFPEVIEELKKDETLFVQQKGENVR